MTEELPQKGETQPTEQSTETAITPEQSSSERTGDVDTQVKELQQKLEAAQKLADSYKDQLLRKAAEFDNYKKRSEADYGSLVRSANEGLLNALIPVVDDFTRSMKSGRDVKDYDSLFKGIELIYNKFTKLLESYGLKPFDSIGQPFDVEYHDALMQMPRSDVPHHTVVEEIQRGYKLFDKVLRHAKVIVSAEPSQKEVSTSDSETNGTGEN